MGRVSLPGNGNVTRVTVRSAHLPADPRAARYARAVVAEALAGSRCARLLDVAQLLVSELVGNAVRHAYGAVRMKVMCSESELTVAVEDPSPEPPRPPDSGCHDELAEGGRGICLLDQLSTAWGTAPANPGKSVWFRLDANAR